MTNLKDYLNDLVEETVKAISAGEDHTVSLDQDDKDRIIEDFMDGVKRLMGIE